MYEFTCRPEAHKKSPALTCELLIAKRQQNKQKKSSASQLEFPIRLLNFITDSLRNKKNQGVFVVVYVCDQI